MALVHKLLNGKYDSGLFTLTADNGRPRTRQAGGKMGLVAQFARTDQRKFSFAVRAVNSWNRLPEDVRQATTKESFKSKLKRHKQQASSQAGQR